MKTDIFELSEDQLKAVVGGRGSNNQSITITNNVKWSGNGEINSKGFGNTVVSQYKSSIDNSVVGAGSGNTIGD